MGKPKLLECVHSVARLRHLSLGTERAYSDWIRRFILFHKKRQPAEMGADEVRQFLTHLAVEGHAAASAQNVALCALLFLYRDVLGRGVRSPLEVWERGPVAPSLSPSVSPPLRGPSDLLLGRAAGADGLDGLG